MSEIFSDPATSRQMSSTLVNSRASLSGDMPEAEVISAPGAPTQSIQLDTGQGKTIIADGVVAKIAGVAAREIDGVHDLVAISSGISGFAGRLNRTDQRVSGVSVEVGQREAAVDLNVTIDYGVSIPQVAAAVRHNIMERVHAMTGLIVKEVNINAADLYFPGEPSSSARVQ
ncbi:MAG: Asp23/Gls24 family envelope stress response protein [Ktedonobacterales bacterium]